MARISEALREAIKHADCTRYRISQETGVDESVLSRFMSGGNLTLKNADKVAEFLGLELKPEEPAQADAAKRDRT